MSFNSFDDIRSRFPGLNVVRIPSHTVFPLSETRHTYDRYSIMMFQRTVELPKDSIGIHWYGSSRTSQNFNNKITRSNYMHHSSTICKIIREVA